MGIQASAEHVDAYELIQSSLQQRTNIEDFMEVVTTTLIYQPNLINLDNILYIIDDRGCRHRDLKQISGRLMLEREIEMLDCFSEYPQALVEFFFQKFGWTIEADGGATETGVNELESDFETESEDEDDHKALYSKIELLSIVQQIIYIYRMCYALRDYTSLVKREYVTFQQELSRLIKSNHHSDSSEI